MTKTELIREIATKAGIKQTEADKVLKAFTETITNTLVNGGSLTLLGFGTFEVNNRAERKARKLQTKEIITIPATKLPKFRAGKSLKEAVKALRK